MRLIYFFIFMFFLLDPSSLFASIRKDFFIKVFLSNHDPFISERVIVRYYLYTTQKKISYRVDRFPTFSNSQKKFKKIAGYQDKAFHDGKEFFRYLIYEADLFPISENPIMSSPMEITASWYHSQLGFTEQKISSQRQILNPRPLPRFTQEQVWENLVGDYQFKVDFKTFSTNEGLLRIVIEGEGNLEFVAPPALSNSIFRVKYVDKKFRPKNFQESDQATFSFYLEFEKQPPKPFEKIEFFYFNPNLKRYRKITEKIDFSKINIANKKEKSRGRVGVFLSPYFGEDQNFSSLYFVRFLLLGFNLLLLFLIFLQKRKKNLIALSLRKVQKRVIHGRDCYSSFRHFFKELEKLPLSVEGELKKNQSFQYISNAFEKVKVKEFSKDKSQTLVYKEEHFKDLYHWLRKYANTKEFKGNSR